MCRTGSRVTRRPVPRRRCRRPCRPSSLPKPVGEGTEIAAYAVPALAPCPQPAHQLTGALRILNKQIGELRGVALGHTGIGAHQRRDAAAERLVDTEPVCLVSRGVDQSVTRRHEPFDILAKAQKGRAGRQPRLGEPALPQRLLGARAGDHEVPVPGRLAAQLDPRFKQRVEPLASVPERANEEDVPSVGRPAKRLARCVHLVRTDEREPIAVDAVVDHPGARHRTARRVTRSRWVRRLLHTARRARVKFRRSCVRSRPRRKRSLTRRTRPVWFSGS